MEELGLKCRWIRCRQAGHLQAKKGLKPNPAYIRLTVNRYEASEGVEVFLAYEDVVQDILVGWLRLRIPSERAHRPEVKGRTAIVRELHVSGPMVPRGLKLEEGWQHKGYGRSLMAEAERLAREEYDVRKLLVNSALGVKEYYFKLGYRRDGAYVSKTLP
jgi:elongator complex protein 3